MCDRDGDEGPAGEGHRLARLAAHDVQDVGGGAGAGTGGELSTGESVMLPKAFPEPEPPQQWDVGP